jgi:hypothetical protein
MTNDNALVVAPAPEKTPPAQLAAVWTLAGRILEQSSCLLVFGFAFNPYDQALLSHLTTHGRDLETVMLVDINPNLEGARQLWPHSEVRAIPPPPAGSVELAEWLMHRG